MSTTNFYPELLHHLVVTPTPAGWLPDGRNHGVACVDSASWCCGVAAAADYDSDAYLLDYIYSSYDVLPRLQLLEICWAFSIYLEAVAIFPRVLQGIRNVDDLTGQCVLLLGKDCLQNLNTKSFALQDGKPFP